MRRDNLMKTTEILIRANKARKPTNLMSDTRISYRPFMDLVEKLLKLGLLEIVPDVPGMKRIGYRTTDLGRDFVSRALVCYKMIEEYYVVDLIKKVRFD